MATRGRATHGGSSRVARRSVMPKTRFAIKVNAGYAQRAEYIWTDGQEGLKGLFFNEMRSKTKVIQKPVPVGGSFPDWSFDGSRYEGMQSMP